MILRSFLLDFARASRHLYWLSLSGNIFHSLLARGRGN